MTIAYIKSNVLRRTLLIAYLPIIPPMVLAIACFKVAGVFVEEVKDFSGDIWRAIRQCWDGEDVRT